MNIKGKLPQTTLISGHNTIQNFELILEQFFDYHITYQWDKAKEYIEHEREQFRVKNPNAILTSLFNCFTQMIFADRNYFTLKFFLPKVFQRKDLLKSTYGSLLSDFQRLEEKYNQLFLKHNFHLLPFQSSPIYNNNQVISNSVGSINELNNVRTESETAKDALDYIDVDNIIEASNDLIPSNKQTQSSVYNQSLNLSSSLPKDAPENISTSTKSNQNFFSKFFRKFSSNPTQNININNKVQEALVVENVPDDQNHNSETTNLDSLDHFSCYICGQLIKYCKIRIDMIDFYERLTTISHVSNGKFWKIDDCLQMLIDIYERANNFSHPVFRRIKMTLMFECEILLALLQAHQYIQQWKYLESLFSLQDAHNKINRMANPKEFFFGNTLLASIVINSTSTGGSSTGYSQKPSPSSPVVTSLSSLNRCRNFGTSSSLSSSGSSNLSAPFAKDSGDNHSPISPSTNFIYPVKENINLTSNLPGNTSTGKHLFQRDYKPIPITDFKSIPLLIQWFHKFKLFLLSKYTFYFHSLLMIHLAPVQSASVSSSVTQSFTSITSSTSLSSLISQNTSSASNYNQTELFIRNLCAKCLPFDFHTKIVHFIRKLDSSYFVVILNTNGQAISLTGYQSPYIQKDIPQGRSSLPIIYSYPGEFNMNRHPPLIMIMNNRMKELNTSDTVVIEHDSNNTIGNSSTGSSSNHHNQLSGLQNASYFLVRPDPNYTMALICESKRNDTQIIVFMQDICASLRETKILTSLRSGNFK